MRDYRKAAREVLDERNVRGLVTLLAKMAFGADGGEVDPRIRLDAIRALLAYTIGKPRQMPEDEPAIPLGRVTDAESLLAAAGQLTQALAAGQIGSEEAARVATVLEVTRRTLETQTLEQQLKELREVVEQLTGKGSGNATQARD
jgi:hypothetical protein